MGKLYYFQAPNFDINPDSQTAPRLGGIFPNLTQLTAPLNQDDHLQIPENLLNNNAVANFSDARTRNYQADIGVNSTAGQGITGSADLIYTFARDKKNIYHCETLETVEFEPDKAFVSDSITASQRVQTFISNSLFGRKRVYMITGLKIASGFSISSSKASQHSPTLKIGLGFGTVGIPAEAGPELGLSVGSARTVEQGRALNKIVFAYRIIRIKDRWDGEPRFKYESGGKYAAEEDSDDSDEDGEGKWVLEPLSDDTLSEDFPDSVRIEIEG
ncbi:hypothetical protein SLS63_010786 [Diaporthe eres]|uniref:Uncharacterized protein n=1 Tax=Diaporthe eres TaxID=83184 RepID=A0ABR1NW87_DIAER